MASPHDRSRRCDRSSVASSRTGDSARCPESAAQAASPTTRHVGLRASGSIIRRLVGGRRHRGGTGPRRRGTAAAAPSSLEAELAERLDTVLGIAERLAASHDREELFRTIVDETQRALRADATTIRILRDDRLEVAAWAGLPDDVAAARCRSSAATRAGSARSCGRGRVLAWPDVRDDREHGVERYDGSSSSPATSSRRSSTTTGSSGRCPRSPASRAPGPSGDVAFISTLATHAAIALTNAELFEQTEARAAQLERPPGRLGPAEPGRDGRGGRPDHRRGDPPDHRLPQRPGLPRSSRPTRSCRSPSRAASAPTSTSTCDLLRCQLGEGFTGWVAQHGEPLLVNDANRRPARRDDRRDRRRRRVDARRADALRRRDDRGHHALQARARRVRRATTCAS